MNDTPRTDANDLGWQFNEQHGDFDSLSDNPMPWLDFAKMLERELDTVTEQRDAVTLRLGKTQERMIDAERQRDRLAKACDQYSEDEILCKLHKVTEQRDRLVEALDQLIPYQPRSTVMAMNERHVWSNAWQALESITPNDQSDAPT